MATISTIHFTIEADDGFFGKIKNIESDLDDTSEIYRDIVHKTMNKPTRYGQIVGEPGTASNAFCVLAELYGGECILVDGDISYPTSLMDPRAVY